MNEDQYVVESALHTALAKHDPSKEQIIAWKGCGKMWKYNPRSNNGTLAKPKGTGPDRLSCDNVHRYGGVCGGTGPDHFCLSAPATLPLFASFPSSAGLWVGGWVGVGGVGGGCWGRGGGALLSRANIS